MDETRRHGNPEERMVENYLSPTSNKGADKINFHSCLVQKVLLNKLPNLVNLSVWNCYLFYGYHVDNMLVP